MKRRFPMLFPGSLQRSFTPRTERLISPIKKIVKAIDGHHYSKRFQYPVSVTNNEGSGGEVLKYSRSSVSQTLEKISTPTAEVKFISKVVFDSIPDLDSIRVYEKRSGSLQLVREFDFIKSRLSPMRRPCKPALFEKSFTLMVVILHFSSNLTAIGMLRQAHPCRVAGSASVKRLRMTACLLRAT